MIVSKFKRYHIILICNVLLPFILLFFVTFWIFKLNAILCIVIETFLFLVFIKYLVLFKRVKIGFDKIYIYNLLNPFYSEEYRLDNFDGYYLTGESIIRRRKGFNIYWSHVAWLSNGDTLLLKIYDFYSNFQEILDTTSLPYKGSLPITGKKYKKYETVKAIRIQNEEYEKLLSSVKKEPSSSQKNLNKLEIHIDPQKEAENDSKTYKMN